MIDDRIALFRLPVIITIKRGTSDIQARIEIPGSGKVSIKSRAERRDRKIQDVF